MRKASLFLLVCVSVFAQNAALLPVAKQQFFYDNASGQPLAGGFIYTCVAGTACTSSTIGGVPSNPQTTYTDSTATTANPNPIVLDAAGQYQIWGPCSSAYKIVVQNYAGVIQYTADNVTPPGPCSITGTTNPLYVNLGLQSGAVANSPGTCNDAPLRAAIAAAVTGPGFVLVPAGTWYLCSTINIPQGVMVAGPGHWSQSPEFGTVQNAVLKAGSTFSVGSGYQSYMFTLGGLTNNTQYGGRIENVSVDGSGIANGEYVAQAGDHSGMAFVDTLNFPNFGVYVCGSGAGGPCGTNEPNGAQLDGDYHDLRFLPNDSYGMTASTISIYVNNAANQREWRNISIIPTAANPSNKPTFGMAIWGTNYSIKHLHVQSVQYGGVVVSPAPSTCTGACNGTIGATFEDINVTNSSGANAVIIGNETNLSENFINVSSDGSPTCLISYMYSTYTGCISGSNNSGNWLIDAQGVPMGHEYLETFNGGLVAPFIENTGLSTDLAGSLLFTGTTSNTYLFVNQTVHSPTCVLGGSPTSGPVWATVAGGSGHWTITGNATNNIAAISLKYICVLTP